MIKKKKKFKRIYHLLFTIFLNVKKTTKTLALFLMTKNDFLKKYLRAFLKMGQISYIIQLLILNLLIIGKN